MGGLCTDFQGRTPLHRHTRLLGQAIHMVCEAMSLGCSCSGVAQVSSCGWMAVPGFESWWEALEGQSRGLSGCLSPCTDMQSFPIAHSSLELQSFSFPSCPHQFQAGAPWKFALVCTWGFLGYSFSANVHLYSITSHPLGFDLSHHRAWGWDQSKALALHASKSAQE